MKAAPLLLAAMVLTGTGLGQRAVGVKPSTPTDGVRVRPNDAVLSAAMQQARHALPRFLAALRRPGGPRNFAVKRNFADGPGRHEYLWLDQVQLIGGRLAARIANTPEAVHTVQEGQVVLFPFNEVVDWLYVQDGLLYGGFTMRVYRDRMTLQERARFDNQLAAPLSPEP